MPKTRWFVPLLYSPLVRSDVASGVRPVDGTGELYPIEVVTAIAGRAGENAIVD